jgi:hypothetical protein
MFTFTFTTTVLPHCIHISSCSLAFTCMYSVVQVHMYSLPLYIGTCASFYFWNFHMKHYYKSTCAPKLNTQIQLNVRYGLYIKVDHTLAYIGIHITYLILLDSMPPSIQVGLRWKCQVSGCPCFLIFPLCISHVRQGSTVLSHFTVHFQQVNTSGVFHLMWDSVPCLDDSVGEEISSYL